MIIMLMTRASAMNTATPATVRRLAHDPDNLCFITKPLVDIQKGTGCKVKPVTLAT